MSSLLKVLKNNKLGRSLLSVILAAAVLCSTLSMVTLIPAVAEEVWDGTTQTAPVDSDNDGVYEITNATELYSTINTYDNEVTTELVSTVYDNQPAIKADSNYYYFGFYGADVKQNPLSDEADKVVYFDRSKGIYHSFPAAVRVYKENTNNFAQLTLSANKTYEVRLKYYSASTPSVPAILQLRVAHQRFANQTVKDEHILCPEIVTIVGSTDGWVEATAKFTTPATLSYNRAIITLSNSSVDTVYYDTKVYIDDVRVSECAPITTYNYDGEKEETVYASDYTTVADLPAAADWTAASIEVTLNNGQKQGYVPALMVKTTDAAVVEFDHIYMTYPVEDTENLTDGFNFVTSENWYPSLALFDGITIPEASEVWNGETEAPTANDEGIYIIDTAEKLAYIIKNGGKMIIGSTTTQEPVVNEMATLFSMKKVILPTKM